MNKTSIYRITGLRISILILSFIVIRSAYSQNNGDNFIFSGYVSSIQNAKFEKVHQPWLTQNMLHNRLNFQYNWNEKISSSIELRNRLAFGEEITLNPGAASYYSTDNGWVDLSRNIASGNSYVFNSTVDRAFISYESGKLKTTLGRQRINWGQTFVWNPNDIFNAYSFFDFDYVERPGSDAFRLQYYNSEVSSTELAIKTDATKKITIAALYRFNRFSTDFQVLAGLLAEQDYVLGTGWSGAIGGISIRSEASWFQPVKRTLDTSGIVLASVSADYTFSNSLTLMAEYLFNNNNISLDANFLSFYQAPQTIKSISFVKHSIVGQISYPLTPLINTSLACMYLPEVKGVYVGPTLAYNLAENMDASLVYQGFFAKIANIDQRFHFLFLRLKWSF